MYDITYPNIIFSLVTIFIIYSIFLYFRYDKEIIIEIVTTSIFIIIVGWINVPNFFSIDKNYIENKVSFLPYHLMNEFGIFYVIISSCLLVILIEFIKLYQKNKYSTLISKRRINKKYDQFVSDAVTLYVIGKDLDFLIKNKKQFSKFKELRSNCRILNSSDSVKDKVKPKYSELLENRVDVRKIDLEKYENKFSNLRGQIKIDTSGVTKCLFVEKSSSYDQYNIIEITNSFIIESLKSEFEKIHNNGFNPLIKCIAMDLGGVYFDGDYYKDFVCKINKELNLKIDSKSSDTVLLDRELNLGEKKIEDVWSSRAGKAFNENEKEKIKSAWKKIWTPNKDMKLLVEILVKKGYEVYPFGNIDKENGEHYKISGYFDVFNNQSFMSYEQNGGNECLLPDKIYFENFMKQEQYEQYEILLIDDEKEDIKAAKSKGLSAINFNIKDDVPILINELVKLKIINEDDRNLYLKMIKGGNDD